MKWERPFWLNSDRNPLIYTQIDLCHARYCKCFIFCRLSLEIYLKTAILLTPNKLDFQLNAPHANQKGALGRAHGFLQVQPRPPGATKGPARARWGHAGPNRAAERLPSPQRLVPLFVKF